MNYTEMLNEVIDKSGMMLKDIASACQKEGVNLTNTYLSSLRTTPGKVASDEISRAIARVCGAKFEDVLVVQAYLDKAPECIVKFIENYRETADMAVEYYEVSTDNIQVLQAVQEQKEQYGESLAEFVCASNANMDNKEDLKKTRELLQKYAEPKCMIITAEQQKNIKFVNEKDLTNFLNTI